MKTIIMIMVAILLSLTMPLFILASNVNDSNSNNNDIEITQTINNYLSNQAMSKNAIIHQLINDGYRKEKIIIIIDDLHIDWLQQAKKCVSEYRHLRNFSDDDLILQLFLEEKFTFSQAVEAVKAVK